MTSCGFAPENEAPTPSDSTAFERLRALLASGGHGRADLGSLPRRLSDATDHAIAALARGMPDVALVAVGGYGRRQQCVGSDVDLLILYRGAVPAVDRILHPLWDARLKVGHAVRTVRESALAARQNVETLSSLMDARLIAGDGRLFTGLQREVRGVVVASAGSLHATLAEEESTVRTDEPYHTLVPNLKNSRGCLRTLHRIHWERRRQSLIGSSSLRESAEERSAKVFLLSVRNALHMSQSRVSDRLEPELREPVARRLDMSVSELMGTLTQTTSLVEDMATDVFAPAFERRSDPVAEAGRRIWWAVRRRTALSEGSDVLARAVAALRSPGLAQLEKAGEASPARWTSGDLDRLFEIVTAGADGRRVWDALWRSGWLPRELPEWDAVVRAPQLAPIHAHPVDGHLFRTVDEVLEIADSDDLARREALDELGGPNLAVWAGLFHDIGKGRPGDHSEVGAQLVEQIGSRLGLPELDLLSRAVRHHLLLPEVAITRDVASSEVIDGVAATIGDQQLARLLYVLAAADGRATGTGSWTPWRAQLVDRLYRRVMDRLAQTGPRPLDIEARAERLDTDPRRLREHARRMSPGYLLRHDDEVLKTHVELASAVLEPGEIRHALIKGGDLATAVVVSRDVPGLAARIAGACAEAGISILEGRFERTEDGVAVDTFVVADERGGPVGPARFDRTMTQMTSAPARATAPLDDIEVELLAGGSIVEIRGVDRPGFLADVCAALTRLGHDITLAKIDTRAGAVIDVFYVDPPIQNEAGLGAALGSSPQ